MSIVLIHSGYHKGSVGILSRSPEGGRVVGAHTHAGRSDSIVWLLSAVATALAALYLIALYQTFGTGLAIQQNGRVAEELTRQTVQMELALQVKKGRVANDHAGLFSLMEKISAITYLEPENVAVARASPHP